MSFSRSKSFLLFKRLIKEYMMPYRYQLLIAVIFMAVASAMTAVIAGLLQPILDDVLSAGSGDMIVPISIGLALSFSLRGITTYIHVVYMNKVGQSIIADIQNNLFSHFMKKELAYFHEHPSGQLISRVVNDVTVMRSAVTDTLTGFGKSLLTLIFLIGVMFYRDWKLTLAAFIVFPLIAAFVVYIGKRLRKVSKSIQSELGSLSDILSQSFHGIRLIKAYSLEEQETSRVSRVVYNVRNLNIKSVRLGNLSTPINDVIIGIIFSCIIAYGGYSVLNGESTAGSLASFIAAFTLAYEPMKKLSKLNSTLQIGLGAADRVFQTLDEGTKVIDNDGAEELSIKTPIIRFDGVSFQYENAQSKALHDITFTAKPNEVTALVGPSGGGKSTIMNMIPRFYDVSAGAIYIDDQDISNVTQQSLRDHIALVSQDITIFNVSAFENIRYGRPNASAQEVYDAAKKAAAYDFIEELDQGFDTILGEDGTKLSGGQKQRISIARAILRDAPILLLDEATSALDNESEHFVKKALHELEQGRTTLVIAHRLSTIQDADNIIVLENGAIVEQGKHEALIEKNGLYAKMFEKGFNG